MVSVRRHQYVVNVKFNPRIRGVPIEAVPVIPAIVLRAGQRRISHEVLVVVLTDPRIHKSSVEADVHVLGTRPAWQLDIYLVVDRVVRRRRVRAAAQRQHLLRRLRREA